MIPQQAMSEAEKLRAQYNQYNRTAAATTTFNFKATSFIFTSFCSTAFCIHHRHKVM
jgi:hypothetical protein